jgi:hypothetical protein
LLATSHIRSEQVGEDRQARAGSVARFERLRRQQLTPGVSRGGATPVRSSVELASAEWHQRGSSREEINRRPLRLDLRINSIYYHIKLLQLSVICGLQKLQLFSAR